MSSDKVYTFADLDAHKSRESLWLTIGGSVYDVTKFLDEHPGGDEVLLEEAGRDGTEAFEDVGHSDEARADLKKLYIGKLDKAELGKHTTTAANGNGTASKESEGASPIRFLFPVAVLVAWFAYRKYFT